MHAAVEINRLTKDFRLPLGRKRFRAVDDLSLAVAAGEVYGLLGPNGSGKSTTMKMLLGLVRPSAGTCAIFGRPSTHTASRLDVGFLPENPYFYRHLSGAETLRFYGRLCGLYGAGLAARVGELLALVGLEEAAGRPLAGYSKGMLQRIGLAQALVHDPRLVLLDEPTAGVDPAGSRQIRDLILALKQRGKTVILSSHLLEQVQEVCDRVGILDHGKLVREGRLDELTAVAGQFEIIVEGGGPGLPEALAAAAHAAGGKVVASGHPRTTLESLFLAATSRSRDP
jgi:ABC-2 type transport system ATP-binding protein